jgi:hypothetical protein
MSERSEVDGDDLLHACVCVWLLEELMTIAMKEKKNKPKRDRLIIMSNRPVCDDFTHSSAGKFSF